jgi:hypothetical protein
MIIRIAPCMLALLLATPRAGPAGGTTSAAELLFRSGFEDDTQLLPPVECWSTGCWQRIEGTDATSGFTWPPRLAAGAGRFLLLTDPVQVTAASIGHYTVNRLETVLGPQNRPTRALYQEISHNINGAGPMGSSAAQDEFQLLPRTEVRELYMSFRMKLQPDLVAGMSGLPDGPGVRQGGTWRGLLAIKTGHHNAEAPLDDGDYRVEAYVSTYGGGPPYWAILGDNNAGGGAPQTNTWQVINRAMPVPVGTWFRIEFYWLRSAGQDGRVWMAVDGQVIADRRGANLGAWQLPVNRIIAPLLYGGGRMPLYQWVDDLEVWSGMPPLIH